MLGRGHQPVAERPEPHAHPEGTPISWATWNEVYNDFGSTGYMIPDAENPGDRSNSLHDNAIVPDGQWPAGALEVMGSAGAGPARTRSPRRAGPVPAAAR